MDHNISNSNIPNSMRLEEKILKKFTKAGQNLAIAESCTGGLIGNRLTDIPGASAYFFLGIAAYDNAAKTRILGVSPSLIKKHGAVSAQTASAMAIGVRKLLKTSVGLSVTGIAGPGGATIGKPVGLVYIALSNPARTIVKKFLFKGSRVDIKKQAADTALKMLAK